MDHPPVLLVHGFLDRATLFRRMAAHLEQDGRKVAAIDLVPNNAAAPLERLALQVKEYADAHFPNEYFDLLGFSMGGLVCRSYLQRLGGLERVRRFISISSPHRGTYTAYGAGWWAGVRQMQPGSHFLQDLNRDYHELKRVGFVSLWTPFDLMILPATSSLLPDVRSIRFTVPAHPLMVRNRKVLETVAGLFGPQ